MSRRAFNTMTYDRDFCNSNICLYFKSGSDVISYTVMKCANGYDDIVFYVDRYIYDTLQSQSLNKKLLIIIALIYNGEYTIEILKNRFGPMEKLNSLEKYIKIVKLFFEKDTKHSVLNVELIKFLKYFILCDEIQLRSSMVAINALIKLKR